MSSQNNQMDQLVAALLELEPGMNESALRFVGESEGADRLREMLRVLRLVAQLRS